MAKREKMAKNKSIAIRLFAIMLALATSAILIMVLELSPLDVYQGLFRGAFGSAYRIREVMVNATALVITSLGIAIAFKMQFWNIGGEGQIMMGAFFASYLALNYPELPQPLLLSLMIIAGLLGGGLWALPPAYFKAKWRTNETIVTLMMNYIALNWVTYLQFGPWKDPQAFGFPKIPNFSTNGILPQVGGVHLGWIMALLLVVIVSIFLNRTKKGYEIAVLGESESTAQYAGINIKSTMLTAIFYSGALCGLTGMLQASAVNHTLSDQLSAGIGFTAIITTWLAFLNPYVILLVSVLFAALVQGGAFIQIAVGVPQAVAQLLQGLILFFVLGSEFFIRYKLVWDRPNFGAERKEAQEE